MQINTKYNINDKVWCIIDNTIKEVSIYKINVIIDSIPHIKNKENEFEAIIPIIQYQLNYKSSILIESKLFKTKKDLIANI